MNDPKHPMISHDPDVMSGGACVRGTRLTVATVLHMLWRHRGQIEKVLVEYPDLTTMDVLCCIAYAADRMSKDRVSERRKWIEIGKGPYFKTYAMEIRRKQPEYRKPGGKLEGTLVMTIGHTTTSASSMVFVPLVSVDDVASQYHPQPDPLPEYER